MTTQPHNHTFAATETYYKGILFRSRIEARWAVFFDALSIPWLYEPEQYRFDLLNKQVNYLPDFWLPNQRIFIEIKGPEPTSEEQTKAMLLASGTRHSVYIFWGGIPTYTPNGQTRYEGGSSFSPPTSMAHLPGHSVSSAWCYLPSAIQRKRYAQTSRQPERIRVSGKYDTFHHWAVCPKCGYTNIAPEGKTSFLTIICGCELPKTPIQLGRAPKNPLMTAYNRARAERFGS